MTANQRWIAPTGDGWRIVSSADADADGSPGTTYRTQEEAITAARDQLMRTGGGELVVQGEAGRIVRKDTVGRLDPRRTAG